MFNYAKVWTHHGDGNFILPVSSTLAQNEQGYLLNVQVLDMPRCTENLNFKKKGYCANSPAV